MEEIIFVLFLTNIRDLAEGEIRVVILCRARRGHGASLLNPVLFSNEPFPWFLKIYIAKQRWKHGLYITLFTTNTDYGIPYGHVGR
jgi:hypothetical protein